MLIPIDQTLIGSDDFYHTLIASDIFIRPYSQVTSVTGVLIATDYALYVSHTFWEIRVKFVSAMMIDNPLRTLHFGPDPIMQALTGAI